MATESAFDYRGEYGEDRPMPERLTLAQYRHVIFRPDAHFVDGRIVPRNLGVQNIWLVDPLRRAAWTFDATSLHEADPTQLTVPDTPIHLDLTEAFAALD